MSAAECCRGRWDTLLLAESAEDEAERCTMWLMAVLPCVLEKRQKILSDVGRKSKERRWWIEAEGEVLHKRIEHGLSVGLWC